MKRSAHVLLVLAIVANALAAVIDTLAYEWNVAALMFTIVAALVALWRLIERTHDLRDAQVDTARAQARMAETVLARMAHAEIEVGLTTEAPDADEPRH